MSVFVDRLHLILDAAHGYSESFIAAMRAYGEVALIALAIVFAVCALLFGLPAFLWWFSRKRKQDSYIQNTPGRKLFFIALGVMGSLLIAALTTPILFGILIVVLNFLRA